MGSLALWQKLSCRKQQEDECVERMVELAAMSRKDGMMALEGQPVPDKFFEKGMQMLVDGADEQKLVKQMKSELSYEGATCFPTRGCSRLGKSSTCHGYDWDANWTCFDAWK